MSDSDATKDEKKTEEASGKLTNDQQVIDQVETENQAEKELQDDEEATEIPKIEDGQGKKKRRQNKQVFYEICIFNSYREIKVIWF